MDAGRLDLLENGQVRSGVDGRALCGLVVVRVGVWVSLVTTAVLTRIPSASRLTVPAKELYTLAWGQAAWLPCPCQGCQVAPTSVENAGSSRRGDRGSMSTGWTAGSGPRLVRERV